MEAFNGLTLREPCLFPVIHSTPDIVNFSRIISSFLNKNGEKKVLLLFTGHCLLLGLL